MCIHNHTYQLCERCFCMQTSLNSEMKNMSFTHITTFTHRHFTEARHDFQTKQRDEFLRTVAADMASEAAQTAFATAYIEQHQQPDWDADSGCDAPALRDSRRKLRRKKDKQRTMPKHMYIDDYYRSDFDRGISELELQPASQSCMQGMWHQLRVRSSVEQ